MLLLFVVRSNACLGIDFVLFIFDIFVVSLGCLVLYYNHIRFDLIVILLLALKLCFWACMHVHTYECVRILEAYHVSIRILVPKNANFYAYAYSCPEM